MSLWQQTKRSADVVVCTVLLFGALAVNAWHKNTLSGVAAVILLIALGVRLGTSLSRKA